MAPTGPALINKLCMNSSLIFCNAMSFSSIRFGLIHLRNGKNSHIFVVSDP